MRTSLSLLCLLLLPLLPHTGASDQGIIGGKNAKSHSRPYMASLQNPHGKHFCGGFLIREDFVMTAAHCLSENKKIQVVLGTNNIKRNLKSKQKIQVKKCYQHPEHSKNKYDFDIMLCKLERNATLNKDVKVIELPNQKEKVPDETQCLACGWGQRKPKTSAMNNLQEVFLNIQNSKQCAKAWRSSFVPERMLCTHFNGKKGICQGDSGGPLVCMNKAHGIAAFTAEPCSEIYPNVFMKTSAFVPWIKDTMKK